LIGQPFQAAISLDQKDWVYKIPMMEFTINASISKSMGFAPFELGGVYMPTMIHPLPESNMAPPGVRSFAQQALQNLAAAHDRAHVTKPEILVESMRSPWTPQGLHRD